MAGKPDDEESVGAELTAEVVEETYQEYAKERQALKKDLGTKGAVQAIYGSYVEQFLLLQHTISRAQEDDSFGSFVRKYGNELEGLESRRRKFLDKHAQDIESDEAIEVAYDERQRLAKEAALQKKAKVEPAAKKDERPDHVVIDILDSSRSVPPAVVVRRSGAESVAGSRRDDDERTMYSARSGVSPRVMGGASMTTASSRRGAESVDGEEERAEKLSASTLSARSGRDERNQSGARTARSGATESVSEWVDEVASSSRGDQSQVDGLYHDDPSMMRRAGTRQGIGDDDLESLHEGSVARGVGGIYGEIKVFSVPGGKQGYLDHVIEDHFEGIPQQHLKLSQSEYNNFVGAVDQRMGEDLKTGVLKNIEPEPVTPKISKYNIKGHTLEEIENDDGTLDFKPEAGLSGVVRVQRRDKSGALIDAYDTIEYQEGKVSRLIVGGEGLSRLGDIGLPKERGVLVAGEMSPEEQAKFASMSARTAREEGPRQGHLSVPRLDLSRLNLPHIDGDVVPSARVTPIPTPKGVPVRILKPGSHTPGSSRR